MRLNLGNTTLVGYPIDGSDVSSAPTNKIPVTALQHVYLRETDFRLKITDAPVSCEYIVHMANGPETVQSFYVGMNDTGTAASSTFDLLKNGVSILSSVVTVANTDPDKTKKSGTIASPALVDNDILSVKIVMTTNTGAAGPFAQVPIIAAASPV